MTAEKKKKIPFDNISKALENVTGGIPKEAKGKDEYFDLVSWNLRWFNSQEPDRVELVSEVLSYLNADIFVLQEIEPGSLDIVIDKLKDRGAGTYKVFYGTTGGDQRIAVMYDLEWIRSKDDIIELFGKGAVKTGDNKDVFPRLPLKGYFLAKSIDPKKTGFTFQLVGVHLKSQMGGGDTQRIMAAEKLAYWLSNEANDTDADTIIIGDWNKGPEDKNWKALHEMEKKKKVMFKKINDPSAISHLYYRNKSEIGSRLDVVLATSEAYEQMASEKGEMVHWVKIEDLMKNAMGLSVKEIKEIINLIKEKLSDHLPLHVRYYQKDDGD